MANDFDDSYELNNYERNGYRYDSKIEDRIRAVLLSITGALFVTAVVLALTGVGIGIAFFMMLGVLVIGGAATMVPHGSYVRISTPKNDVNNVTIDSSTALITKTTGENPEIINSKGFRDVVGMQQVAVVSQLSNTLSNKLDASQKLGRANTTVLDDSSKEGFTL